MINIEVYNSLYKNIWDDFVNLSKVSMFMFKRDFMEYHSDRFIDHSLMFFDNDELIALLPLSLHDGELRSHGGLTYGGFLMSSRVKQKKIIDCFSALKSYMEINNFSSLIYKKIPYIYYHMPSDEDEYALWISNAKIIKIEPSTTIDLNNRIKFSKGRKSQISRAKRENVKVMLSLDFDEFIKLENEILQKYHQTRAVHTSDELSLLKERFSDNIKLFVAVHKEQIIAGALVFEYLNCVHTQYLAANDLARKIGGLDLVILYLIDFYSDKKRFLDFGISTENHGLFLNEGLISQKESFGGSTVSYQTWKLTL